ncbi:MAG: TonB family protein, partial [Candidatus Melainabacteria bacterium]|nr:TonB family protein [Candidatus Melainabacteria bacterium]
MQTVKSREPETAPLPEPPEDKTAAKPETAMRYQPGKAALLSLIPGLGHFYVGQPVVGSLVLVSSFLGLTFLTTIIAGKNLFPVVAPLAESIGIHLDKAAGAPQVVVSPIALTLYILTILYLGAYFAADAYQQALRKSRYPDGFKSEGVTFTGSTSFSYLMHCALLVICAVTCLFIVKVPVKTDTVIEIELEPPPVVIPPPPPPAPRPKPKAEAPKVEKPEPVKPVQPPKPVPIAVKPVDTPVSDNPSPVPVTQPEQGSATGTGSQGTAGSGTGTGSGDGTGTSDEVDLSDYISAMEKKIRKSWFPPKGEETKKIILKFKINGQGAASSIRLKASSGIMMADEAAMTAVKTASPFAPLP